MALEKAGLPTVTLISCSFCTLAQEVAKQVDYPGLPILLLPHPLGDADLEKVRQKGREAAEEAVHLLTMPAEALVDEFMAKKFPLPEHAAPKF